MNPRMKNIDLRSEQQSIENHSHRQREEERRSRVNLESRGEVHMRERIKRSGREIANVVKEVQPTSEIFEVKQPRWIYDPLALNPHVSFLPKPIKPDLPGPQVPNFESEREGEGLGGLKRLVDEKPEAISPSLMTANNLMPSLGPQSITTASMSSPEFRVRKPIRRFRRTRGSKFSKTASKEIKIPYLEGEIGFGWSNINWSKFEEAFDESNRLSKLLDLRTKSTMSHTWHSDLFESEIFDIERLIEYQNQKRKRVLMEERRRLRSLAWNAFRQKWLDRSKMALGGLRRCWSRFTEHFKKFIRRTQD